ncbi:glutamate ABC transporter substrate-binding protein [Streptomyces sp. CRN 30]|uniref:glutamate ABC transporter substrate-binding protein n=1 Tax=Streptomyces sp. CRN 30 TaxID=3075613 RepID=UPI002A80FE58|nr:glutamate ABC transporter substrate-binding protein [Streptomyces sp. CRN 30]
MNAVRRLRASAKGWGGVGGMVVACALTATLALPPLRDAGGGGGTGPGGPDTARVTYAKAEECTAPENRSLRPSADTSGATIREIEARGHLIVGVDQNSYRWGYRDPNSENASAELEGFDIDLAHEIADALLGDRPDNIRFRAIPTDQRIPAIQEGRVDMVVRTMTISCSRLEQVAFSAPYFRTGQQVLAPRTSRIEGYDETLAGRRICAAEATIARDRVRDDIRTGRPAPTAELTESVPNQLDCLVQLQLGRADAVVTDGALAASQAAQDPTVELKGAPFTTEYYGVAMRKDADDLVRRVNRVLEDYRGGGWQQSYGKWLSETLGDDPARSLPPSPGYR